MTYRYLEEMAPAEVAFEAAGATLEELFISSADAILNVITEDVDSVLPEETRRVELKDDSLEMLLFTFLQEIVLFKDTEQLLLRVKECEFLEEQGEYRTVALLIGERLDPLRRRQKVNVKAIRLDTFHLEKEESGWRASVTLDV